jgi:formamidopyrimidine-DNA glycosylase
MPELPEVETIVCHLRPTLSSKKILSAEVCWERTVATPSVTAFKEQIVGQVIHQVTRRAKFIILQLTDFHLLVHLRMSGDLYIRDRSYQPGKHDRLLLLLSGDTVLVFNDSRKFGRIWLTRQPEEVLGKLGPEPLDPNFQAEAFVQRLRSRRRLLKPLLLDQSFLAGLGNIYTDEALHLAGLHPLILSDQINDRQAVKLFEAIRSVLQDGITHNGASIDWVYRGGNFQNYFRVYDRAGQPCPVCGTPVERMVVGQRGTHFCPSCQVRG